MKLLPVKTNSTFVLAVILFTQFVCGQSFNYNRINGEISVDSIAIEGVYIVNLATEKSVLSDKNGSFYLFLKQGDVLVFSAINLDKFCKVMTEQDVVNGIAVIKMIQKNNQLKEVLVVKKSNANAVSLGIVSKN
jgi:hypothetical protein